MPVQGLSHVTPYASPKRPDFQKSESPDRPVFSRRSDDAGSASRRRTDLSAPFSTFSRKMDSKLSAVPAPQKKTVDPRLDGMNWPNMRDMFVFGAAAVGAAAGSLGTAYWSGILEGGPWVVPSNPGNFRWDDFSRGAVPGAAAGALFGAISAQFLNEIGELMWNGATPPAAARRRSDDLELGRMPLQRRW